MARNPRVSKQVDTRSIQARRFLRDLAKVCRKHNLSLSHEDGHGAFIVTNYRTLYENWLLDAAEIKEFK